MLCDIKITSNVVTEPEFRCLNLIVYNGCITYGYKNV